MRRSREKVKRWLANTLKANPRGKRDDEPLEQTDNAEPLIKASGLFARRKQGVHRRGVECTAVTSHEKGNDALTTGLSDASAEGDHQMGLKKGKGSPQAGEPHPLVPSGVHSSVDSTDSSNNGVSRNAVGASVSMHTAGQVGTWTWQESDEPWSDEGESEEDIPNTNPSSDSLRSSIASSISTSKSSAGRRDRMNVGVVFRSGTGGRSYMCGKLDSGAEVCVIFLAIVQRSGHHERMQTDNLPFLQGASGELIQPVGWIRLTFHLAHNDKAVTARFYVVENPAHQWNPLKNHFDALLSQEVCEKFNVFRPEFNSGNDT